MVEKSNKLSKWDEAWLSDKNKEKYEYAIEYIRTTWPSEVAQSIPPNWSDSKQNTVRNLFCKLIQKSQFDTRGIIRRTKEAWRSHHKKSIKRNSRNYTHVKLTNSDKNKMRVLAKEAGLSSVSDVVSSILQDEYNSLLSNKKFEREQAAKKKESDKSKNIGFMNNYHKRKLKEENSQLKSKLLCTEQELESFIDLFSKQLITLERYQSDDITPLIDTEFDRAQELRQNLIKFIKNKLT